MRNITAAMIFSKLIQRKVKNTAVNLFKKYVALLGELP